MKKQRTGPRIKEPKGAKVIMVFLVIYAVCLIFPYTIAVNGAFRDWGSFVDNIFAWKDFTLENFKKIFTEFNYPVTMDNGMPGKFYFVGLLINSVLFSVGCAFASSTCPLIVGYCTARFPNAFSRFVINLVYVLMALPIVGTIASEIQMTQNLGIYNTIPGMWFLKFNFLGMYTLIYHANFKSMAKEYFEAAYMDGAGHFTIFTKIMVPMVSKTWTLAFLLSFIGFWSDYGTPLYFMPDNPTLSLALLNFNKLPGSIETMQLAAALLLAIPSLTLFVLFRKKIVGNIQTGGIKG
ncbi:MAG: carbohydrate ABC transporter permease [Oscillospiraceae bacterium]|nr:carbohydrate ABC transporter permease [Oscillospiraceae bacterium]